MSPRALLCVYCCLSDQAYRSSCPSPPSLSFTTADDTPRARCTAVRASLRCIHIDSGLPQLPGLHGQPMELSLDSYANAYDEPDVVTLLVLVSFILFLNVPRHVGDTLLRAGLLGELLVGFIYDRPLANTLQPVLERAFTDMGYVALVSLAFHGGLETDLAQARSTIGLATLLACIGVVAPVGLSILLLHVGSPQSPIRRDLSMGARTIDEQQSPIRRGLSASAARSGKKNWARLLSRSEVQILSGHLSAEPGSSRMDDAEQSTSGKYTDRKMVPGHRIKQPTSTHPNEDITFVSCLRDPSLSDQDRAMKLMNGLAAQFRRMTRARYYTCNSLEEAPYNTEFLGRNWNKGEVIEIVLRNVDGSFRPFGSLVAIMCHELAHNVHSNHGPNFQKLDKEHREEIKAAQGQGYFGEGLWSDGRQLETNDRVAGENHLAHYDMDQYLCAGDGSKKRKSAKPSRRRSRWYTRRPDKYSGSGRPGGRKAKAGSKNNKKGAFAGEGQTLDADESFFRKRAQSQTAKELRAEAAERRLAGLPPAGSINGPIAGASSAGKKIQRDIEDLSASSESDDDAGVYGSGVPVWSASGESDDDIEEDALHSVRTNGTLSTRAGPSSSRKLIQPKISLIGAKSNGKSTGKSKAESKRKVQTKDEARASTPGFIVIDSSEDGDSEGVPEQPAKRSRRD
ncbi:hypothetical protein E5Q_00525 [Mixia osmundae IAM 14324]|uniref:WLM domain-containing protein n=1 Tax=Mixia osmundae (strain CBS 9802 / IAM 14324 / JCM 22182 / KY 12970) TaxID=764103 RepID=G7DTN2_MIXOS|nr:hypothetical protein E5Q_00525 [Mixia osmundae IAM 14324]